jgi:hypothetical protein
MFVIASGPGTIDLSSPAILTLAANWRLTRSANVCQRRVALASPAGRIGDPGFSPEPSAVIQQEVVCKELSIFGSRLNRRLLTQVVAWLESGACNPKR